MNLPHDNPLISELSGNAVLLSQIKDIRLLFQEDDEENPEKWERIWLEDEREEVRADTRNRRAAVAERLEQESGQKLRSAGQFEPGDMVMLRDLNVAKQKGMKFDYRWTGPFMVHARTRGGSYVLRHIHDQETRLLYAHHHCDDLKLWSVRPLHLRYPTGADYPATQVELPTNMRQYRKGLISSLKGKV
ncbi:hypothetical protein EDC01DRAFT_630277 [Geopyxis carbonaria]|nr:hypothetical protein EDC01DRAFT_630277 [Geopyxis carbonaria]